MILHGWMHFSPFFPVAFTCPFEGCGRCFSVLSNMRRHARVHDTVPRKTREGSSDDGSDQHSPCLTISSHSPVTPAKMSPSTPSDHSTTIPYSTTSLAWALRAGAAAHPLVAKVAQRWNARGTLFVLQTVFFSHSLAVSITGLGASLPCNLITRYLFIIYIS